MLNFLFCFLAVFTDRFRGNPGILPKQVKRLLEAYVISGAFGHYWGKDAITITLLIWSGICLGSYGNAIGPGLTGEPPAKVKTAQNHGPEWWQAGPLLDSTGLSLVALGALWGLPVALYGLFHDLRLTLIPFALSASFLLSTYMSKDAADGSWAAQQWIFGVLMAVNLTLINFANMLN